MYEVKHNGRNNMGRIHLLLARSTYLSIINRTANCIKQAILNKYWTENICIDLHKSNTTIIFKTENVQRFVENLLVINSSRVFQFSGMSLQTMLHTFLPSNANLKKIKKSKIPKYFTGLNKLNANANPQATCHTLGKAFWFQEISAAMLKKPHRMTTKNNRRGYTMCSSTSSWQVQARVQFCPHMSRLKKSQIQAGNHKDTSKPIFRSHLRAICLYSWTSDALQLHLLNKKTCSTGETPYAVSRKVVCEGLQFDAMMQQLHASMPLLAAALL